ncbi:MAG: GspE/PulE family protein [bacterium]|nr:GspE/PulE family protein [bacterium]
MATPKVVQYLIDKGLIHVEDWISIEMEARKTQTDPEILLVDQKKVSEIDLAKAKAELYELPFVDLANMDIPTETLAILPETAAQTHQVVPFERKGKNIKIAMVAPGNYRAIEAMDFWSKKEGLVAELYVTTLSGFHAALKKYKGFSEEVGEALDVIKEREVPQKKVQDRRPLTEIVKKAPVTKIVSLMIKEAADAGASDIHIEPGQKETRVRFRIDGILRKYLTLPSNLHASLISRIKVLARLQLDETRIPQDGRIRVDFGDGSVDLRVSTLPLLQSEKVVMRLLPSSTQIKGLEELGFAGAVLETLKKNTERPVGVMIISGPTGSGKSTTLYSMLETLNDESRNIITLEDPVEFLLAGINQVQVLPEVGLTFASGLRSILRQDPNIIMVGEIRDNETAELAIHAALTGHFMLSTIHAKDVLGVIPRLLDMHVEPFLISAALNTIMAQRLVRKICKACKEPLKVNDELIQEIKTELKALPPSVGKKVKQDDLTLYHGAGCPQCNDTGYKGRIVLCEVLTMNENMREIIRTGLSVDEIAKEMFGQGIPTLKQDGILKALAGITSIEEVMRVTRE